MSALASLGASVRLIHPAPSLAVTALSGALGAILVAQAGRSIDERWLATVVAVAGSQVFVGATNDLVDRPRDVLARRAAKPLVAGDLAPSGAVWVASLGLALVAAAAIRLPPLFALLGAVAVLSALSYNLWLSRTPASVIPYLVSFGTLPLWIAAGVGVPLDRVAATPLLVAPFAAAAHLANVLRDFDADATQGSRNLAQVLGRSVAFRLAWVLAMAVGIGVGGAFVLGGPVEPLAAGLGLIGLVAVAQGIRGPSRLWAGMLAAAVAWTAAWALATA
jgi:4-hydroxybenzoate polyprenyltransferase